MVGTDESLQLRQDFAALCLERLIEDNLTLARRLDKVAGQLSRLLRLEAKSLELSSEVVDGDLGFRVKIVGVEEKWGHLISDQFLLL